MFECIADGLQQICMSLLIHDLTNAIKGLVQDCGISSAIAREIP